jgi:uncharacterized membrane protein (DUF106 family)
MTYGAILGIVSIIFSLMLYMLGILPDNFKRMILIAVVGFTIMIIFIVIGTKSYRDKVLGGTITFGNALFAGVLIVVFSTIISSFYTLIFNMFIDPEYMNKVYESMKNWMYDYLNNMGVPDAQIEKSMDKIESKQANYTPLKGFFQSIFSSVIVGLILSLITSAFIKKTPNPFAQDSK